MLTSSRAAVAPRLLLALVVAACGSIGGPSPAGSTGSPSASPSEAQRSESPLGSIEPLPSVADLDLGAAAKALENIDSYHIKIDITGSGASGYEATVVREPDPAQHVFVTSSGATQEIIVVGDQAWLKAGDSWQEAPASMAAGFATAFDPILLMSAFNTPAFMNGVETIGQEDRNGQATTHYRLSAESAGGLLASMPPGSAVDFWLATDGYLVSFHASDFDGEGSSISCEVSRVNDPANVVEPPI